ncbi:MAG: GspB domain-containing protein [Xanthomonadales bacterium]|nr:GspB domain-containing protein [Xanthomonadales bacterium]
MSFLLDALRKSEDQKRSGAVPTIHGGPPPSADERRPAVRLYALLILLPLLLVFAWYISRLPVDDPGIEAPAAASTNPPAEQPAPADQGTAGPAVRNEPARNTPPTGTRTPVEEFQPADPPPRAGSGANNVATVREQPPREPETVNIDEPRQAAVESASNAGSGSRSSADGDSPLPGLITYWELPGSVRGDIMDMNISVMVFAEQPEDRFILMNGQRWVEGDEPQRGLRIEEIRREGVVFTFRRYRFLVKQ